MEFSRVQRQSTSPRPKSPQSARSGASQSSIRPADRLSGYLLHHQLTAVESLVRLLQAPVASLLTWLVVAVALALPAGLYLGLENLRGLSPLPQGASQMSVFLDPKTAERAVSPLRERILARADVATVDYISPTQALAEFRDYSGLGRVLDTLDDNPLPALLLVQPTDLARQPDRLEALRLALQAEPLVEDVSVDMAWVNRLHEIMALGQRLVMALGGLLALGVLLVIGNTLRLAIENRRDEIVIVKLVGGTDAFVRRPFLYTGFWYGVGGGLLAVVILALGLAWLAGPVGRLSDLYQADFQLRGVDAFAGLQLVLAAGLLGLAGAWLAVGRHLGDIEPK